MNLLLLKYLKEQQNKQNLYLVLPRRWLTKVAESFLELFDLSVPCIAY